MGAKRTTPKPLRQEEIFKALMVALVAGAMDDVTNSTNTSGVLSDGALIACLTNGIPPDHQIAVMNALAELVKQINIQTALIERRGICPN